MLSFQLRAARRLSHSLHLRTIHSASSGVGNGTFFTPSKPGSSHSTSSRTHNSVVAHANTSKGSSRAASSSSSSPTNTTATSSETEASGKGKLKFLPRPLGVPDAPRIEPLSFEERKAKLLSREERLKERKHLTKEFFGKAYWEDIKKLDNYGGKMWIGAPALIKESASLYLPNIEGKLLSTDELAHTTNLCRGRISLVCILTSVFSEAHVKSFTEEIIAQQESNPRFRFLQINLQDNPLRGFLVSLFTNRLKTQIPEKMHKSYMLSSQNMEYLREPIGFMNKFIGYVYLVDENLKIRWAGCGFARPEEKESLNLCTAELLERLQTQAEARAQPATKKAKT